MPENDFLRLGFNDNEKEVYLTVLRAGKVAAHRVASLTGINRTTVYSIGKKLASLGLISEDKGQKIAYFVAEKPEKILSMLEREENAIQEKKKSAQGLIKELAAITSEKQYSVPRIKFVEEVDLSEYLYAGYTRWKESAERNENIWWGYQDDSFTTHYDSWIDWANKANNQSGPDLKVQLFFNKVPVEQVAAKKYTTRVMCHLPNDIVFDTSLFVAGDYIMMVQTRVRPHYLVEIHDEVLARNQRALFKGLWGLAK